MRSYKIKTNKRIDNVKKQLVGFICDLYLGRISKEDIKRLGEAANVGWLRYDSQDLTQDDFNLIARAWFFWKDGNGFEWQDKTECLACGKERQEHEKDGTCPILT